MQFCFRNKEAAEIHFWEYIYGNQTFILDPHRPFICSVIEESLYIRYSSAPTQPRISTAELSARVAEAPTPRLVNAVNPTPSNKERPEL